MNTQNIVRLEVDDGNGIQVIDIDSGKPFAIVLPLNVLSWVSSFVLYGFGELVVNSAIIAGKEGKIVVGGQSGNTVAPQNKSEKITALNNLKARGLISEEEYSRKLAELESKR